MSPNRPSHSPPLRRRGHPVAPRSWQPEHWGGAVARLVRTEVVAGATLTAAVVAALVWANVVPHSAYAHVWSSTLRVGLLPSSELATARQWVDNGLMTVFFLAVGLEVGRERACGALQDNRTAALPIAAAGGGMAGAAVVYVVTVAAAGGRGTALAGWGVPMATDVAFTLSAMALLGRRVPPALRVFVLALAVADDVGSVVVLAFVGSGHVQPAFLVGALAVVGGVVALRRRVVGAWWPYAAAAAATWYLFARGGIEPTLAGAFVGLLVPCGSLGPSPSASARMEGTIAPISALVVLPLFALANTGIVLSFQQLASGAPGRVLTGIVVARLVGKAAGIAAATALTVRLSPVRLPRGVTWAQLVGAAILCGMGFTVPLMFATAAFAGDPSLLDAAQAGLLAGTVLAAGCGAVVLEIAGRRRRIDHTPETPTGHDTPVPPRPQ